MKLGEGEAFDFVVAPRVQHVGSSGSAYGVTIGMHLQEVGAQRAATSEIIVGSIHWHRINRIVGRAQDIFDEIDSIFGIKVNYHKLETGLLALGGVDQQ